MCLAGALAGGGSHITPGNINAVRDARAAATGARRIWLTPAMAPLLATFGLLAGLTYIQVDANMAKNRMSHRPHGLLGPTVNEFLRDPEEKAEQAEQAKRLPPAYRDRLHKQNVDARHANKQAAQSQ